MTDPSVKVLLQKNNILVKEWSENCTSNISGVSDVLLKLKESVNTNLTKLIEVDECSTKNSRESTLLQESTADSSDDQEDEINSMLNKVKSKEKKKRKKVKIK